MPDFFKKLKKKADKKKTQGSEKKGSSEKTRCLKFLPLGASTTSLFCRRRKGDADSDGEYSIPCYNNANCVCRINTNVVMHSE